MLHARSRLRPRSPRRRCDGLHNRGLDPDKALEEIATLETRAAPAHSGARRAEARAERGRRRGRARQAAGHDTTRPFRRRTARARSGSSSSSIQLDSHRASARGGLLDAAEPAAPERAGRQERGRQRRGAAPRRAAHVRFRAAGALGSRAGARHPRLRARRQDRRGAFHGPVGAARGSRARSSTSCSTAHARARLSGGRAAVHGQQRVAHRHRQPAEVRGDLFKIAGDWDPCISCRPRRCR